MENKRREQANRRNRRPTPAGALLQSKAFLAAYELCDAPDPNLTTVPAVVCLAFAAELGLKSLLLSEKNPKGGHELKDLFSTLKITTQDEVTTYTHTDPESFRENLELASNAFQKWRYIYEEKDRHSVSIEFLCVLVSAIQRAADARADLA